MSRAFPLALLLLLGGGIAPCWGQVRLASDAGRGTLPTYSAEWRLGLRESPPGFAWQPLLAFSLGPDSASLLNAVTAKSERCWVCPTQLEALTSTSPSQYTAKPQSLFPREVRSPGLDVPDSLLTLYSVEPAELVHSEFGQQFWRGWTFITSIEVSLLTVTMLAPKEWTGWHDDFVQDGLSNLERAWTSPPEMDGDHWFHNYVGHPYGGNVYYNTVRSQGATPAQSFFFSALLSAQWEYLFEAVAEQPSIQDLIITPTTGAVLGEVVHRITLAMKKNGTNLAEKAFILLANPTHVVMRGFN